MGDMNLLKDYYQPGTNQWAAERKQLAVDEQKLDSWWMNWPDDGVDIDTIKLDIILTWAANLEGKPFKSFYSTGLLGHNQPGGLLEKIPYYKFALAHCARRVHTPQMYRASIAVKEHAVYRYDKFWGFRSYMHDFFKILNMHKAISRDVDIDEIKKKASSKKGRNFFNFYRLKNNDYGFVFLDYTEDWHHL